MTANDNEGPFDKADARNEQLYADLQEVVDFLSATSANSPEITANPIWREMVAGINERWSTFWDDTLDDD